MFSAFPSGSPLSASFLAQCFVTILFVSCCKLPVASDESFTARSRRLVFKKAAQRGSEHIASHSNLACLPYASNLHGYQASRGDGVVASSNYSNNYYDIVITVTINDGNAEQHWRRGEMLPRGVRGSGSPSSVVINTRCAPPLGGRCLPQLKGPPSFSCLARAGATPIQRQDGGDGRHVGPSSQQHPFALYTQGRRKETTTESYTQSYSRALPSLAFVSFFYFFFHSGHSQSREEGPREEGLQGKGF